MSHETTHLVSVVHSGLVLVHVKDETPLDMYVDGKPCGEVQVSADVGLCFASVSGRRSFVVDVRHRVTGRSVTGSPHEIRAGGWKGGVQRVEGRFVQGYASDDMHPERDVSVVAFSQAGVLAFATAKAEQGGAFLLVLPHEFATSDVTVGIVGSDFILADGRFTAGVGIDRAVHRLRQIQARPLTLAIKISTPNLRVAHEWGDYHFANSLKSSLERIGVAASVDTNDVWYDPSRDADVVLTLRGRHGFKTDPGKLNLLWIISHPDRIEPEELNDYDHIFVASDIYARSLRRQGYMSVSVLHQATDQHLFKPKPNIVRQPRCLFVGNSRREYRTMIRWCIEKNLPLDLYGGLWDGLVPPELVKAENIPNSELSDYYAGHLLLLNDHWDSMRDNGFPSNRLFDGSAVGTPIITDAVGGLAEVFGDTIHVVRSADELEAMVANCIHDPAPYLSRAEEARQIVLGRHTFDHRAGELQRFVERHAKTARSSAKSR